MANNFDILAMMADKDMDIRMSTTALSLDKNGKKSTITMFTDEEVILNTVNQNNKYHFILIVADQQQYDECGNNIDLKPDGEMKQREYSEQYPESGLEFLASASKWAEQQERGKFNGQSPQQIINAYFKSEGIEI